MTDLITFIIGFGGFAIVAAIAYRAGQRHERTNTRAWARDCLAAEHIAEILYTALDEVNNPHQQDVVLTREERETWGRLTNGGSM